MLYTWELVEQKEKQEKEIKLKERVALQQKLIKKCEKYIEDKKTSELQKNIKVHTHTRMNSHLTISYRFRLLIIEKTTRG